MRQLKTVSTLTPNTSILGISVHHWELYPNKIAPTPLEVCDTVVR